MDVDDVAEAAVDDMPAASTPTQCGAPGTHLFLDDEYEVDLEVRMIEQCRDADQLVEDREDIALLRRSPVGHALPDQP